MLTTKYLILNSNIYHRINVLTLLTMPISGQLKTRIQPKHLREAAQSAQAHIVGCAYGLTLLSRLYKLPQFGKWIVFLAYMQSNHIYAL